MAKRNAYFIRSKITLNDEFPCDKCGMSINEVNKDESWWNPNPRAHHRNICANCHSVWAYEREERHRLWRDKYQAMKAQNGGKSV